MRSLKITAMIALFWGMVLPAQAKENEIAVFASASFISNNYETPAYQFGKLLGQQKNTLIYNGAGEGLAGSVLKGAVESKAKIIGVSTADLYKEECPAQGLCQGQEIEFVEAPINQMERLFEKGDALVILPGGWDMMNAFTTFTIQVQNKKREKKPVVFFNINHYWDNLRYQLDEMKRQKILDETQTDYISFVDKPRNIFKEITKLNRVIKKNNPID